MTVTQGITDSVYALKVFDRQSHGLIAVYGAEAKDVVKQDEFVYGKYSQRENHIDRIVLHRSEFRDFSDFDESMSAQEFAEWALGTYA